MKKINLVYTLLFILAACGGKPTVTTSISGEIKGLGNDTLYLFGADPIYDGMDTLPVKEGKFSAELSVDTLVTAYLLFDDGTRYPIFIGKGNSILIKGNVSAPTLLEVTGNTANDELTAYQKDLKGLGKPSERALQEKAEALLKAKAYYCIGCDIHSAFFYHKLLQSDIRKKIVMNFREES